MSTGRLKGPHTGSWRGWQRRNLDLGRGSVRCPEKAGTPSNNILSVAKARFNAVVLEREMSAKHRLYCNDSQMQEFGHAYCHNSWAEIRRALSVY